MSARKKSAAAAKSGDSTKDMDNGRQQMDQSQNQSMEDTASDGAAASAVEKNQACATEPERDGMAERIEVLGRENEELKREAAELKDKYLRLLAEYDNYRKRTARERECAYLDAVADAVCAILPVADNMERALQFAGSDPAALREGIQRIVEQFGQVLSALGVEPIESDGKPFDPELHNAIMREECADSQQSGTVLQTLQKGYTLKGKVIRHSLVKIAE